MKVRFLLPLLFYFHQKMLRVPINAGFVGIFFFVAAQIFVGKSSEKCNTMQHEMQHDFSGI